MTAVTLNNDQRVYVINSGHGYSCLGFDVVFSYIAELVNRIAKAGKVLPVAAPQVAEIGTLKQYEDYQSLMTVYRGLGDKETWFDARTPEKVRKVLERYRKSGARVRVFYGDEKTGRDWMEEFDMVGTIGRSMGPMRSPLLIPDNEDGGPALLTQCIVRMVDVETGKEVYKHEKYHLPKMELRELTTESIKDQDGEKTLKSMGYTHGVWVEDKDGKPCNHANFKSLGKAAHWMAFMAGESCDLRD